MGHFPSINVLNNQRLIFVTTNQLVVTDLRGEVGRMGEGDVAWPEGEEKTWQAERSPS